MSLTRTSRGTGGNTTSATSITISPASNCTAGALVALWIAYDNNAGGGADPYASISDSLGNTWTPRQNVLNDPGAALAGTCLRGFTTNQNAGAIQTGTVITVSFGAVSVPVKVWTLEEVSASAGTPTYNTGATGGNNTAATATPNITTASIPSGSCVLAAVGAESGTTQVFTADSDTTNGSWSTNQQNKLGTTAGGQGIISQGKVVTATATQSFNIGLSISSDTCIAWMRIDEVFSVSPDAGAHAHAATSPSLNQEHIITPASGTHAFSSSSPTVEAVVPPLQSYVWIGAVWPTGRWIGAVQAESIGPTPSSVTPDSATHAHAASSPSITQEHTISPASGNHAHVATSPTLTQTHILTPNSGSHAHTASSPTLTVVSIISPNDAAHAHSAGSPSLSQDHFLTPSGATHGHSASSPALSQLHVIVVSSASHAHSASSPSLSQIHIISPAAGLHGHTASSPTLSSIGDVLPNPGQHAHSASSPAISQLHEIVVQAASHAVSSSSPSLTQLHSISVDSAAHGHQASSPAITQVHIISPASGLHGHSASSPTVAFIAGIFPSDSGHGHTATSPSLLVTSYITPNSAAHAHSASSPSFAQTHVISPASTLHAHTASSPILEGGGVPIDGFMHMVLAPFKPNGAITSNVPRCTMISFKPSLELEPVT